MVWSSCPHYLGLNNIPICTVKDDENSLWDVDQFNHLETTDNIPFAKCSHPPSTAALESPVRGVSPAPKNANIHPPRPHSGESHSTDEIFPEASCKLLGNGGGEWIEIYMIANIAVVIFKQP